MSVYGRCVGGRAKAGGRWRLLVLACVVAVALVGFVSAAGASEYAWDANTILLEHFNGSHSGTAMWGAPDYQPSLAPLGQAARLDYTQDLLAYRPPGLPALQNAGTIEMWAKLEEYPLNGGFGLCELQWAWTPYPPSGGWVGHYTVTGRANLSDRPGTFIWSIWGAPTPQLNDGVIPLNEWTHIAVTWSDVTGTTIYMNGVPTAHTAAKVWPASPQVFYMGWWPQGSPFAPILDEVRVSSVARTPAEIAAHVASNSNRPPQIVLDATGVGCCEGDVALNEFTCIDPDGDAVTPVASVGTLEDLGSGRFRWRYGAVDGPSAEDVTIMADDGRGGTDSATFHVDIANAAPECAQIDGPAAPVPVGTPAGLSVPFSDAGTRDTHAVTIDWGDGSISPAVVNEAGGQGSALASHVYARPDVYTVTATVVDCDGAAVTREFRYVVAYDPSGGFVTGGGTIMSVAGAYAADPAAAGKANFGFVSKYLKGANVPTGNTEFVFHAVGMRFSSTSYEWLVIAGPKAQYKGSGELNGVAGYRFMLTAIDGQVAGGGGVDKIRVRIWDAATSALVYDNQRGASPDADPTTAITGGSIVVHKAK